MNKNREGQKSMSRNTKTFKQVRRKARMQNNENKGSAERYRYIRREGEGAENRTKGGREKEGRGERRATALGSGQSILTGTPQEGTAMARIY